MAAVIKCDACEKTCSVKEAKHIRIHRLTDAEHFDSDTLKHLDVCPECYDKLCEILKLGDKKK